ncbi:hypothetical protein FACS189472_18770 [Alphaproteobacteria bacterium]|nr:hypothetical protein FACS189472_18770 [Alphaproteobacteria bacterium]
MQNGRQTKVEKEENTRREDAVFYTEKTSRPHDKERNDDGVDKDLI